MTKQINDTSVLPGSIDPLRSTFEQINNNYAITTNNVSNTAVVEVINSTTPPTGNVNNLNIGNVYITNKFDSRANNPVLIRQKARVTKPNVSTTLNVASTEETILTFGPFGNQEYINIGETPNDGNGDPLRVAFGKINNNFSNLFLTSTTTYSTYTTGNTQNQVIFEVPVAQFYQGEFQIRSSYPSSPDMQDITLSASITNNLAGVRFSGHSTLFEGNAICRYDMDVSAGNVRILINPLVNLVLDHFISAYVTYPEQITTGAEIALNGYANGYVLGTETGSILITESE